MKLLLFSILTYSYKAFSGHKLRLLSDAYECYNCRVSSGDSQTLPALSEETFYTHRWRGCKTISLTHSSPLAPEPPGETFTNYFYRPQRKVMFSQASVILSTIGLMSTRSLLILVGYSVACYGAVGTHPTGMLSCSF